jgi:hypothetical protein
MYFTWKLRIAQLNPCDYIGLENLLAFTITVKLCGFLGSPVQQSWQLKGWSQVQ